MRDGGMAWPVAAVCVMLAAPAAGQEPSLRDGLDVMARDIASPLDREANRTGDLLKTSFPYEEPAFDVRRIAHRFTAGDAHGAPGALSPEGGNGAGRPAAPWSDPETRTLRTLFAAGPADGEARDPEVGDVFRDCEHCPEMVVVPAGTFMMGSPLSEAGRFDDEGPVRRVTIGSPFAVGVHEVTFAEWDACTAAGGCGGYRPDDEGRGRGRRPVINVNWDDAQAYVSWLSRETGESYHLPSESEWEYAARAGTSTSRYWGDSSSSQCRYANGADASSGLDWGAGCDDGHSRTSPVGSFGANAFGLYDVLGNVREWTQDCWNDSYAGAPGDGSAWESGECSPRVLRGGSWSNVPRDLRAAFRGGGGSGLRVADAGFRVARTFAP